MDDLPEVLTRLSTRLETLESRVALLEHPSAARASIPAPAPVTLQTTVPQAIELSSFAQAGATFAVLGKAMLGMAGAYVLRAVAESGSFPKLAAVALAAAASALASSPVQDRLGRGTGGCPVFPASSAWHEKVANLPLSPLSSQYVASIGASTDLHPDFGHERSYGIPYTIVPADQPKVKVHFTAYGDQSDPGPYPIPPGAPVEGGQNASGDRHVIVLQKGTCMLYELWDAHPNADGSWDAGSGAVFNLRADKLRPNGWTSADATGLSIFAGLIRYDEIKRGQINHAIRFTAPTTQAGFIHPATHFASSSTNPALPPMGLRLRLEASYPIARFPRTDRIILQAMKTYGLILADNGSPWYFQGATDPRWNDNVLDLLKSVPGSAFQAVETGPIRHAS